MLLPRFRDILDPSLLMSYLKQLSPSEMDINLARMYYALRNNWIELTKKGHDGVAKPLQSCFSYLEGSPLDKHMPLAPLANPLSLRGNIAACQ